MKNNNDCVGKGASRAEVYAALEGQRAYQDTQWGARPCLAGHALTIGESILLVEHYHARALSERDPRALVCAIAGVIVRCLNGDDGTSFGGSPRPSRLNTYARLDEERDALPATEGTPAISWELASMRHHVIQARAAWASAALQDQALQRMQEIAAIAVRCLENHGLPLCR